MSDDEAYLEDIKSEEIKKLRDLIYNKSDKKEIGKDFSRIWKEYSDIDKSNINFEDIGDDEILRVMLSSETINNIDSYMKENELKDFNKTIKQLIENGLKSNQEK